MTEIETMFDEGFAEVERVFRPSTGAVVITGDGAFSAVSRSCIFNNVTLTREQRDVGMRFDYDAIAELSRTDAVALGLYPMEGVARPRCTVGAAHYERTDIEDDPHEHFVRLHLRARNP